MAKNIGAKLTGAKYGVYTDKACTDLAVDDAGDPVYLITDENGKATTATEMYPLRLNVGTYYVKEIEPSDGHALDTTGGPYANGVYVAEVVQGTTVKIKSTEPLAAGKHALVLCQRDG